VEDDEAKANDEGIALHEEVVVEAAAMMMSSNFCCRLRRTFTVTRDFFPESLNDKQEV
jgi:hypothetical protein